MNKKVTEFKKTILSLLIVYDIFAVIMGSVIIYALGRISFGGIVCICLFIGLPVLATYKTARSYRLDKAKEYMQVTAEPMTREEENSLIKRAESAKREVAAKTVLCEHIAGLPLAENTACEIIFGNMDITVKGSGNIFKLDYSKVTDITIKTDRDITKQYVSSVGGAVAGGLLFGPVGAIIGGRAKQKKIETVNKYLIITYLKDGEAAYIGFDVTKYSQWAELCVKKVKDRIRDKLTENVVEL